MAEHDKEKMHGSVLFRILGHKTGISIRKWNKASKRESIYIVRYRKLSRAIFIKYRKESNSAGDWIFNFNNSELRRIQLLKRSYGNYLYICLVCMDEICIINKSLFFCLTEKQNATSKSITVKKEYGRRFSVETRDRKEDIPAKAFPNKLFMRLVKYKF